MTPLPPRDQRHLWLRYQVEGYTKEIVHNFEQRLETIFGRQVNRVHILDFEGLTPDMRQDLVERLRIVYTGDDGHEGGDDGVACRDGGGYHRDFTGKLFRWPEFAMPAPGIMRWEMERIEGSKTYNHGIDLVNFADMAPLPPRDQRHLWLRYQVEGYTEEIVHDFEQRLETIFGRQVNRVHILDFKGLTPDMRQDLVERLRMVYTGDDGHEVFVSHAWRRLFGIQAPLVQEFILEFFSTYRIGDEMGLDAAGTLCFQLGGARRSMTWRQFILDLGLHTTEEMAEDGFRAYWKFLRGAPSYTYIIDLVQILCHRLILYNISGRGQTPEKVIATDLFYLRSMDRGVANISYLLAQYLFRHAEGRKSDANLSGGHFIRRLAHHFGLVSDDGLRGLSVVAYELPLIDMGPKRQPDAVAGAAGAAEDAPAVNKRLGRLEEEMQGLRHDVKSLRGLLEWSLTDQGHRCKEIDEVGEVSIILNPMCDCSHAGI
ncbi:hypothetical protein Tco_1220322 [Tanacetum coccineum]